MDNSDFEIYFDQYCKTCKHEKLPETASPCDECLEHPTNTNTHKPVKWEEKEKITKGHLNRILREEKN